MTTEHRAVEVAQKLRKFLLSANESILHGREQLAELSKIFEILAQSESERERLSGELRAAKLEIERLRELAGEVQSDG